MGWKELPEKQEELKYDIRDVEYRKKPVILVAGEMEGFLHAGSLGVANITTIEEGKHVW